MGAEEAEADLESETETETDIETEAEMETDAEDSYAEAHVAPSPVPTGDAVPSESKDLDADVSEAPTPTPQDRPQVEPAEEADTAAIALVALGSAFDLSEPSDALPTAKPDAEVDVTADAETDDTTEDTTEEAASAGLLAADVAEGAVHETSDGEMEGRRSGGKAQQLATMFDEQAKVVAEAALNDPFSASFAGGTLRPKRGDRDYGTAKRGSLTEARAVQAQQWVEAEVAKLLVVIEQHGTRDAASGHTTISFGELFDVYASISDTLVGILMRGRKRGVLTFEADMLFQGVHDSVPITSVRAREESCSLGREVS